MKALKESIRIQAERETQYGSFSAAMEDTAKVCSILLNKELTAKDIAVVYSINKLIRERETHKADNIIDCVAYLAVINDLEDDNKY